MLSEFGLGHGGTLLRFTGTECVPLWAGVTVCDRRASQLNGGAKEMQRRESCRSLDRLVAPRPKRRTSTLSKVICSSSSAHREIGVRFVADHEDPSPGRSA